jgi:hypothetical protein
MMRRIQRDIGSLMRCTYLPASRQKAEYRRRQPFQRVSKDRDSPDITRANEAFDEWLRTARLPSWRPLSFRRLQQLP